LNEIAPTLVTTPLPSPSSPPITLEPDEERLLGVLDAEPIHVDAVIAKSGLSAARVLEMLLGLELKGMVTQLPGTHFALMSSGMNQRKKRL
jgi:DNA processing protein